MGSTRPGRGVLVEGFPGGEQLRGVKRGRGSYGGYVPIVTVFQHFDDI